MSRLSNEHLIRVLVEKGVITSADLAAGGKLNPKQADKFIDYVVDVTGLKNMARIVRFRNEQMDIDKIGVGNRVTVPAAEARDPAVRRGITRTKVTLQPVEVMTPFEISDTFAEVNLEGENVKDHIVQMMARQTGNDIEELAITGDVLGEAKLESDLIAGGSTTHYVKDAFLALFSGWLRQADGGNLVNLGGASVSANIFSQMINAMPIKFRRRRDRLKFLVSPDLEQLFRERISSRATKMGDDALNGEENMKPFGIELVPVPLLPLNPPVVEHVTLTGTTPVSLRYANIVEGSVVVTTSTLGNTPEVAYIEDTDYSIDEATGVITRIGGSISSGQVVKVTYAAPPQIILTHMDNLIFAIGRDIRIEKDRDIFARLDQWAITTKIDAEFEELTAVVKGYNISSSL